MDIIDVESTQVSNLSAIAEIERSRAIQEVQGAMIIAKRFPRDTTAAFSRIIEACKRPSLAKAALYSYPRGGETVTGASIRLAEVMAQNYGNLEFGIREIERQQGRSIAESYCWDLETNVKQSKIFEVPHEIYTKRGTKKLTDPRDLYELVANMGARRLRACILGIIPADIREDAETRCKKTLADGGGEPIADRIKRMVLAFKDFGVTIEMLEKRLGHKIDLTIGEEIVDLQGIYNALKDKQAKRADFFDVNDTAQDPEGKAASLSEKLRKGATAGDNAEDAPKQYKVNAAIAAMLRGEENEEIRGHLEFLLEREVSEEHRAQLLNAVAAARKGSMIELKKIVNAYL